MPEYYTIKRLISKGVAFHHSGMYHIFKEVIEKLLSYKDENGINKPLIKILFATETFAVGVNIPVKASCYTGITKYSGDGFRYLKPYEYKQMSGRAGRRGMDNEGIAIIIPNLYDLPKPSEMFNIMNGNNQIITSRFNPNFQFLLKIILTGNKQIMKFINQSLLNEEIKQQHTLLEEQINNIDIPEFDFTECIKYHNLIHINKNNPYIKISQKTLKKNKKIANTMLSKNGFKEKYNEFCHINQKIEKKELKKNELKNNKYYIHNCIIIILEFLKEHSYISKNIDIEKYEDINPSDITEKGIIASQINECNEILFTELITSGYLDNITAIELVSILSIFLNTKIGNDNVVNLNNSKLSLETQDIIYFVQNIALSYNNYMNYQKIYINIDWDLKLNMVEPVYEWYSGIDFNLLIKRYGLYAGNFVKDIIKLDNIVENVIKMAQILNKEKLVSVASQVHSVIIRDNVNTESLYIHV
jgi:superfamily II RNA helicase